MSDLLQAEAVTADGERFGTQLSNLTDRSAVIEAKRPLDFGQTITLHLLETSVTGTIAFVGQDETAVLVFDRSSEIADLLEAISSEEPADQQELPLDEPADPEPEQEAAPLADDADEPWSEVAVHPWSGMGDEPWTQATEMKAELPHPTPQEEERSQSIDIDIDLDSEEMAADEDEDEDEDDQEPGQEDDEEEGRQEDEEREQEAPAPWNESTAATPFQERTEHDNIDLGATHEALLAPVGGRALQRSKDLTEELHVPPSPRGKAPQWPDGAPVSWAPPARKEEPASPPAPARPASPKPTVAKKRSAPPPVAPSVAAQAAAEKLPVLEADGRTLRFESRDNFRAQWEANLIHGGIVATASPLPVGSQRMLALKIEGSSESIEFSARVGFLGAGTVGFMIDSFPRLKSRFEEILRRL